MLRIAVVEDEQDCSEQIQGFLRQYGEEYGKQMKVSVFRDGSEILEEYQPVYDIILMDIEMPNMNGMDTAEEIRRRDTDVVLVFITNMAQYAIRGYAVDALDFVLKPVNYYTFSMKLTRAIGRVKKREGGHVLLALPGGPKRLDTRQIYFVEIQDRMLHYHTDEGEFVLRGTMQSAEKELSEYHFVRCNYWYLVNLRHVSEVRRDTAYVAGYELAVSRRNKAAFMNALTAYVGGNI